jgi:hypothetical protein
MNILAPVRRDRVLAELPQVGAKSVVGFLAAARCGRGRGGTQPVRRLRPALPSCKVGHSWVVRPTPPYPYRSCLAVGLEPEVGEPHFLAFLSVPEEGGRFARAQRLPPARHLRLPGAPDRHRGVS